MPWYYGKETVKAHSFRVAIPYLCHMCSYELKWAFYFGKIFWGLSSPMPGGTLSDPYTPFSCDHLAAVQLVAAPDPMAVKPKLCVFVYTKATVFCCPGLSIRNIDR